MRCDITSVNVQAMRSVLPLIAALSGCTASGIDRADKLGHLASDGNGLYYVRNDKIVSIDGTLIGSAGDPMSLVVDGSSIYAVSHGGGLDRYARDGSHQARLLEPGGTWFASVRFGLDAANAYMLTIDTSDSLLLPTSTVTYRTIANDTGQVVVPDLSRELLVDVTGDGNRAFGYRRRDGETWTDQIVELSSSGSTVLLPMPHDGIRLQAVAGSLYVLAYSGLWRVDADGLVQVFRDVPNAIVSDGHTLYGRFSADDRTDGCRVVEAESERCLYSDELNEMAIFDGALYFTYPDSGEWVLDRVTL